jgi:hypothetical protein
MHSLDSIPIKEKYKFHQIPTKESSMMQTVAYVMVDFLKDWQSLTAGLLALGAALLTVYIMRKNYREDLQRKELASRARLTIALSELCTYTNQCFQCLWQNSPYIQIPARPDEEIKVIANAIEFSPRLAGIQMAKLISKLQVNTVRLQSFTETENGHPLQDVFDTAFYDLVELRCRINNMFEFSRNETNKVPAVENRKEMVNALKNVMTVRLYVDCTDDARLVRLVETIEKRHS